MSENEGAEWGDIWTTVLLRRVDSERLKKLARPRENRTPYQRRVEHKYEVITRALDLLEKIQSEEGKEEVDNSL